MEDKNFWDDGHLSRRALEVVQINLGDRCNLECSHCHIEASPQGQNNMTAETARLVVDKLKEIDVKRVEFTGGEPLLNDNLKLFIEELSNSGKELAVRTNLTLLNHNSYKHYIKLFKEKKVEVIASLPSYFADETDRQRGREVFTQTIEALKELNRAGYGTVEHKLNLVYNPTSDYLPASQSELESSFKTILSREQGVEFNRLFTITNVPIKRFRKFLEDEKRLESYQSLLKENYNPATVESIMCRNTLSVNYKGEVFDCDFNLALGREVKGVQAGRFWELELSRLTPEITFDSYCYACTAGRGSSCGGALVEGGCCSETKDVVKSYYGKELSKTADLKSGACCTTESVPPYVKRVLPYIADEVVMKYYGCGTAIPLALEGLKVLDLGSGTGRDAFVMSRLVGENGFVYGIDMTEEQIAVAQRYREEQAKRFKYRVPNTKFIFGEIEKMESYFAPSSLDLVTSNCVINLVENKEQVLSSIYKLLKSGGEFYFSDVYADRRVPGTIKKTPLLYGECLGGALYREDFHRMAAKAGFLQPRAMSVTPIEKRDPEIIRLTGNINFYSITYRLWKIEGLEDRCEDYGHVAIYRGGLDESPHRFQLDEEHTFYLNRPERVCGNTALMLKESRLNRYFDVVGSFEEHFGLFEGCGNVNEKGMNSSGGCC